MGSFPFANAVLMQKQVTHRSSSYSLEEKQRFNAYTGEERHLDGRSIIKAAGSQLSAWLGAACPKPVCQAALAFLASCLQSPHLWGPEEAALCWDNAAPSTSLSALRCPVQERLRSQHPEVVPDSPICSYNHLWALILWCWAVGRCRDGSKLALALKVIQVHQ